MRLKSRLLAQCSLVALATVIVATAGLAAEIGARSEASPVPAFTRLPAVDGINGKAEIFGGARDFHDYGGRGFPDFAWPSTRSAWRGGGGAIGSLSAPIGHEFGVQIDAIVAPFNGRIATGGGGHLFWRDPARGLLGVYGSGIYWNGGGGIGLGRAAGEGEAYFGPVTLKGLIGAEFGHRSSLTPSAFGAAALTVPYVAFDWYETRTRFFDKVSVNYYLTDNLEFSVGHIYTGGRHAATLGIEYLLPTSGAGAAASAFVEGRVGERSANGVFGGVRFYLGGSDKTLIRRHREDDPGTHLKDDLFTLSNAHRTSVSPLPIPTCTPSAPDSVGPACGVTPPPPPPPPTSGPSAD